MVRRRSPSSASAKRWSRRCMEGGVPMPVERTIMCPPRAAAWRRDHAGRARAGAEPKSDRRQIRLVAESRIRLRDPHEAGRSESRVRFGSRRQSGASTSGKARSAPPAQPVGRERFPVGHEAPPGRAWKRWPSRRSGRWAAELGRQILRGVLGRDHGRTAVRQDGN